MTTQHLSRIELYIDTSDRGKNKAIFDALFANRAEIESAFGGALQWQRLDQKQAARVVWETSMGGYRDAERWPELHEAMIRLEAAFSPQIATAAQLIAECHRTKQRVLGATRFDRPATPKMTAKSCRVAASRGVVGLA